MQYFIEKLALYVDNTHSLFDTILRFTKVSYELAQAAELPRNMLIGFVAADLRRIFTEETPTIIAAIPYRDQVTRDSVRRTIQDIRECEDWEETKHWAWLAEHYLEKIQEQAAWLDACN